MSDNGLQFDSKAFRKYCSDLGIKNRYSTPTYLQSNGQAEEKNKVIMSRLKKMLKGTKGRWTEELQNVLWAYQTMLRRSTGESPYFLTYGVEIVILVEISLSSMRVSYFSSTVNDELMMKQLDLPKERQEMAAIQLANY